MTCPSQQSQREKRNKNVTYLKNGWIHLTPGNLNGRKQLFRHDLTSYLAWVTGGRIKIGYYTALRLLREGTIRFAVKRDWKERIPIYGLDVR